MACCKAPVESDPETQAASKQIESQIRQDRRDEANRITLLLLGTGDSGKSTFLKQMKIINKNGFTKSETDRFRRILRDNALKSIQVLVEQTMPSERFGKFPKKLVPSAEAVLACDELTVETVPHIEKLWTSKVIQAAWEARASFQVHGAADYYLTNVERFAQENFEPTTDDILRARMRTSGIIETKFEESGSEFSIVDVGGQRTERRKWLHCFEGVSAVIYLAALDEYDMKLEEDQNTNRMLESIKLFGEVTSSQWLRNTSVILFLNKDDLFREKILKSPLEALFPDYTHGPDYKKALEFITEKYRAAFGSSEFLYTRVTCAIDTENIKHIFDSIRDNAFRKSLQNFM